MKLKFSWLKSRKSLIFAFIVDFFLVSILFFDIFRISISNKSIFLILSLSNSLIWIITSYIIGRYSNNQFGKIKLFFEHFLKTFLVLILNLFITQILFRIYWNWDYMNFESFTIFLSNFTSFYFKVFIISYITQFFILSYLIKKYNEKSIWLFIGNEEREIYLRKIIGDKSKFKIKLFKEKYLKDKKIKLKGIIIDDERFLKKENIKFIFGLNNRGLKFMKVSNWCERYLNRYPAELVEISEVIDGIFTYKEDSFKTRIKRIFESFLSLIILIFSLPILLIAAVLIKLEDGGTIFYSQTRNGFEGNQFKILKLRTMIINAEKNGIQWAEHYDKRITKVGKILRKLRIDELPQLLLVLSGDMSLIGPRPERPKIDNTLRECIPNYDLRYSVKPGISGWAQVNFPYGASIEDSRLKLSYDIYYIKNFSFLLDLMILFKTIKLILSARGSIPTKKN